MHYLAQKFTIESEKKQKPSISFDTIQQWYWIISTENKYTMMNQVKANYFFINALEV